MSGRGLLPLRVWRTSPAPEPPTARELVALELAQAGGDLAQTQQTVVTVHRQKDSEYSFEPDRESCSTRERHIKMSAINELLHDRAVSIPETIRTGIAIVAAGIATGAVLYVVSLIVASWS